MKFDPRSSKAVVLQRGRRPVRPADRLPVHGGDRQDQPGRAVAGDGQGRAGAVRHLRRACEHLPQHPQPARLAQPRRRPVDLASRATGCCGSAPTEAVSTASTRDTGKFERLNQNIGLSNETIYGLIATARTCCGWHQRRRLVRFNPASRRVTRVRRTRRAAGRVRTGLLLRGPSGRLYFGSPPGIAVWFRPDRVQLDTVAPKVVLTSLQLYNQEKALDRPIWLGPPIELGYRDTLSDLPSSGPGLREPAQDSLPVPARSG